MYLEAWEAATEPCTVTLQASIGFMDVHRIRYIHIYIYASTDVKVLEVLLWGRIASQPHFSWLVHAVSAPADKSAQICQWAGAEGPKAGACVGLRSPAHTLARWRRMVRSDNACF